MSFTKILLGVCVFLNLLFVTGGFCKDKILKADLNADGIQEKIILEINPVKEIGGSFAEGILRVESKGKFFSKDIGILEFSNDSKMELIKMAHNIRPFIGVFAPGGHGLTLTIYSFNGANINEEISIFSDAPVIKIKERSYNTCKISLKRQCFDMAWNEIINDGVKAIVSCTRDYDNNPVEDSYIKTYKYVDTQWTLVSVYRTKTKTYEPLKEWID